jgi:hypothetical protein
MSLEDQAGPRLLPTVRQLLRGDAELRMEWIRENLRTLMEATDHDSTDISALTGVSVGTVRGFMRGTDSSLRNVILIALAMGVELNELARPPEQFVRQEQDSHRGHL